MLGSKEYKLKLGSRVQAVETNVSSDGGVRIIE